MRRRSLALLILLLFLASQAFAAITITELRVRNVPVVRAQVLTNAVATTNGEWIDTTGLLSMSIHITGITIATVEIDGSNEATKPADATHGKKLNAADITANDIFAILAPMRWTKVRITAWTSGTINAFLEAHGGH